MLIGYRKLDVRVWSWLLALRFFGSSAVGAEPGEVPFEKPVHYNVENSPIVNRLSRVPLPMVDWGFVLAGHVSYVDREGGRTLPLNDAHDLNDPKQVVAVPMAVPSGVQLRAQPVRKGGTFAEELFAPEFPWEENCSVHTLTFDEADQRYKVWYRTKGYFAFAESADFHKWTKPLNNVVSYESHPQTNLLGVLDRDSIERSDLKNVEEARLGYAGGFCVDSSAPQDERYKSVFLGHLKGNTGEYGRLNQRPISAMTGPGSTVLFGATSADGVAWRVLPKPILLHDGDTLSVPAYDPLSRQYRLYTRLYQHNRRTIGLSESDTFASWPLPRNALVPGPEESPSTDYYASAFAPFPQFPSIQTMLCTVYHRATDLSEIRLATSREGHTFHFLPGNPILSTRGTTGDESGFLAAFPGMVRTPDSRIVFFYDVHQTTHKFPRHRFGGSRHYAAYWPHGRLSAIDAPERGEFTLAPIELDGAHVVLNMQTDRAGSIQVELRDEKFRVIPGREFQNCDPLNGDQPRVTVSWKGDDDVSALKGKTIYLAFRMQSAKLFSVAAE